MGFLKSNWISLLAITISIISVSLVLNREDFSGWKIQDTVSMTLALISVCTTLMVASQIHGLRYSKKEIEDSINKETSKIRHESGTTVIKALFRVEILALNNCVEHSSWESFVQIFKGLIEYLTDIKDHRRANELADLMIDIENKSHFMEQLSPENKLIVKQNLWELIKYTSQKEELIKIFRLN